MTDGATPARDLELEQLLAEGVSPWLDGIHRGLISSGRLARLIGRSGIRGATSDPALLARAVVHDDAYGEQLALLAAGEVPLHEAVRALFAHDIRWACDELRQVREATHGLDGHVSMDMDPQAAHDAESTVAEAEELSRSVNRPGALVKIPATAEGIAAAADCIARGIGVHVTEVFSVRRYGEVLDAYVEGLEHALEDGRRLPAIASVASLPIGLLDAEVDARLAESGTAAAHALRGEAALANARLFYRAYEESLGSERWRALRAAGAHPQRLMWTATAAPDAAAWQTRYVDGFVTWGTVNAMSLCTLGAVARHADLQGDTLMGGHRAAREVLDRLERLGILYDAVVQKLEAESVERRAAAWRELRTAVGARLRPTDVPDL
jgi:transaldolase